MTSEGRWGKLMIITGALALLWAATWTLVVVGDALNATEYSVVGVIFNGLWWITGFLLVGAPVYFGRLDKKHREESYEQGLDNRAKGYADKHLFEELVYAALTSYAKGEERVYIEAAAHRLLAAAALYLRAGGDIKDGEIQEAIGTAKGSVREKRSNPALQMVLGYPAARETGGYQWANHVSVTFTGGNWGEVCVLGPIVMHSMNYR